MLCYYVKEFYLFCKLKNNVKDLNSKTLNFIQ